MERYAFQGAGLRSRSARLVTLECLRHRALRVDQRKGIDRRVYMLHAGQYLSHHFLGRGTPGAHRLRDA